MTAAFASIGILFAAALVVFANTLCLPFVHDDLVLILQNPSIAQWHRLGDIFFHPSVTAQGVNAYYRPLLEVFTRLEYLLFGFNPVGWHAVNVILHGINGVLVYRLLRNLDFEHWPSFATAMIFIVHPVQSETVSAIAGMSNLLMAFLVLLALIAHQRSNIGLAILFFVLGLFAKEQAIMALPLFVLIDLYRERKFKRRWIMFFLVAVGFICLRTQVTGSHLLADIFANTGEFKLRVFAIAQTLSMYVRVILWPSDLHYYRSTDILNVVGFWWIPALSFMFLLFVLPKEVRFGGWWFLLALLPVLNFVPLINEYSLILTSEHFLYLPMAGFALMFCILMSNMRVLIMPLSIVLGVLTINQNMIWQSEVALFERTVAFEKNFGRGQLLLAKAYYFSNQFELADGHFERAYAIMDGYAKKAFGEGPIKFYNGFKKGILFDWAHNDEARGRFLPAKAKYQMAIDIDPLDAVLWNNLGAIYLRLNNVMEAKRCFEKAFELNPQFIPARNNLDQIRL